MAEKERNQILRYIQAHGKAHAAELCDFLSHMSLNAVRADISKLVKRNEIVATGEMVKCCEVGRAANYYKLKNYSDYTARQFDESGARKRRDELLAHIVCYDKVTAAELCAAFPAVSYATIHNDLKCLRRDRLIDRARLQSVTNGFYYFAIAGADAVRLAPTSAALFKQAADRRVVINKPHHQWRTGVLHGMRFRDQKIRLLQSLQQGVYAHIVDSILGDYIADQPRTRRTSEIEKHLFLRWQAALAHDFKHDLFVGMLADYGATPA